MKAPAADINIRDNYLAFHHKSIHEHNVLEKKLIRLKNAKAETWQSLLSYEEEISKYFRIRLSVTLDFIALGEKLSKEFRKNDDGERRKILILLVKFCSIVTNEQNCIKELELSNKKQTLTFGEYRDFVFRYYTKVHKVLLQGKAYRYMNGIGTLYIHRVQIEGEGRKIDFHKTKLRKEELQAKGVKLYNKFEADQCKALDLPYDGVDYRVWLRAPAYYSLRFIHSKYFAKEYDFYPISYIHQKYREYSQDQLAFEICENNEDIFDLQIDLRTKIAIYLKRNPERFIDFDRKFNNE